MVPLEVIRNTPVARNNRLLAQLPPDETAVIFDDLKPVVLKAGETLKPATDVRARRVLFPTTAVIAHVVFMESGASIEALSVGCEGMYGSSILLGHFISGIAPRIRTGGHAYELSPERFRSHVESLPAFRTLIHRYVGVQIALLTQQLCCNTVHPAIARCATRLLLTADRHGSEHFSLTHDELATILGGHRPAATLAARALADGGRIRYRHGKMEIVNRQGLLDDSCECYRVMHAATESVFSD